MEEKKVKQQGIEPDKEYLGIPREEIPWYPSIDDNKCDACGTCVKFCRLGTFSYCDAQEKVKVSNPYNCVVGCNGCEDKCPNGAIIFPSTKVIDRVRKKYGI